MDPVVASVSSVPFSYSPSPSITVESSFGPPGQEGSLSPVQPMQHGFAQELPVLCSV